MTLHNRINRKVLKEQLQESTRERITLSFYRYVHLADPQEYRDTLYLDLDKLDVLGRIYVAAEGINGQISVPEDRFDQFQSYIDGSKVLSGTRLNVAVDEKGKSI